MELQAVIEGLRALKRPVEIRIVTDSSYVEKGLREWMGKWKANQWRRRTRNGYQPLKNVELWKELDRLRCQHQICMKRIRGHAGHAENERCDELAVAAYKKLMGAPRRKSGSGRT